MTVNELGHKISELLFKLIDLLKQGAYFIGEMEVSSIIFLYIAVGFFSVFSYVVYQHTLAPIDEEI